MTTNYLEKLNPEIAKNHINRFMHIFEENEIEIIKFKHIQNIIYGFILAIRLSQIDENTANTKLNNLKLRFHSTDHLRYENGIHVSGPHGGAKRVIEIVPNFELKEGYLVTIYNQEGLHPFWGNNIQMASKQMKVTGKLDNEIILNGFGYDPLGNPFKDYGININIVENEIQYITLLIHNRDVKIKYLKN